MLSELDTALERLTGSSGWGSFSPEDVRQAAAMGYTEAVLETRRVNTHAVAFYLRCGYAEIPRYGRYAARPETICLQKSLKSKESYKQIFVRVCVAQTRILWYTVICAGKARAYPRLPCETLCLTVRFQDEQRFDYHPRRAGA